MNFWFCCVCVCDKNWVLTRVTYGWYQHWIMITIKVDDRKILFVSHDKITKIKWKQWLVWNELLVSCVCECDENLVLTRVIWLASTLNYDHDKSWWQKNTVRVTWQNHKNKMKINFSLDLIFGFAVCVYVRKNWVNARVTYGEYQKFDSWSR